MEQVETLRKMLCAISCHGQDVKKQLPFALACLQDALSAAAVGIYWQRAIDDLTALVQVPSGYRLDAAFQKQLAEGSPIDGPLAGQNGSASLALPMRAQGQTLGLMWAVSQPGHLWRDDSRQLLTIAANQIALALENHRLYSEVMLLASRRGELLRRVITNQDERCRRISRELHDEVSQSLAAIALDMEALQVAEKDLPPEAGEHIERYHRRLRHIMEEVNRIVLDLRPMLLEDLGLMAALHWYLRQIDGRHKLQAHISSELDGGLPSHVEITLYRVAQEALTNVVRHARAQNVWLDIQRRSKGVTLQVRDDGRGFDLQDVLSNPEGQSGIGLFGMQERAALVGGSLQIDAAPDDGTCIVIHIPLED